MARLELRAPGERDIPAIVAGCSDPEVARFISLIPVPYTEADAREWLAGAEERWTASRERDFAITTATEPDQLLGVVAVRVQPGGSIGYWLTPEARGRGIMTEAVIAVTAWAEEKHGIRDLFIAAHPDNHASQRVAERAGFVRVGIVDHGPPFRDGVARAMRFERPLA